MASPQEARVPGPRRERVDRAVAEIDRFIANLKSELGVLVQTSTPTTKAIATLLCFSYVVNLILPGFASFLALVPEKTIPCVWNVFTSGFYEMNIVGLVVDAVGVMYLGRLLEPIWGTTEFVNFVVIVQSCVGVAAFVTMYVLYVVTQSQFYIFAKFSGFHGVLVALTVALRQQLPEERVPLPAPLGGLVKLRNKHLPGAYCAGTAALSLANGAKHHHIGLWLFVVYGAYVGWVYLRYFQRTVEDLSRGGGGVGARVRVGDDREEFEFAAQFPSWCQGGVRALTNPCHAAFCGGTGREARQEIPTTAADPDARALLAAEAGTGAATDEDERRRARGAKLLEEKMGRNKGTSEGPPATTSRQEPYE
jgi:membrane associated rhomboid family serine protease